MNRRAFVVAVAAATTLPGCIQSIPEYGEDASTETTAEYGEDASTETTAEYGEDASTETTADETTTDETTMDETIEPDQRVDDPPHEIETPDATDPDAWDDEYLGANLATEPSLAFERIESARLAEGALRNSADEAYHVRVLRDADEHDSVLDTESVDEDTRERLEGVDFDESVLVVVESGYGSSSVDHRWARVEEASDGIHLHGYYTDPFEQFDDVTTWHSVLEVERPGDGVEFARVSLTVDPRRRVQFNSTEGVVTLGE